MRLGHEDGNFESSVPFSERGEKGVRWGLAGRIVSFFVFWRENISPFRPVQIEPMVWLE